MPETGRNDPCPCGSGKKFKKCCIDREQGRASGDFSYHRYRQIESDLIPKLMRCAVEAWGEYAVFEAWDEFHLWEAEEEFSPEGAVNQVFMPYFLFFWTPDSVETECKIKGHEDLTAAEILLGEARRNLSREEVEILEAANRRPLSLYEVLSTKPNEYYCIRNLFTDEEYRVTERAGSASAQVGSIILAAIFYVDGRWQNMATAPFMLRPIDKQPILSLRDVIKKRSKRRQLKEEDLTPFVGDIRALYLDMIHSLLNKKPVLTNTDGDLLACQILHFKISAPSVAVSQLRKLTRNVISEQELLENAVFEEGQLKEVEIPWFKKGKNSNEESGYTVLGRIRINGNKLSVHVNSDRRAKRIRDKIEKLLGSNVEYRTTALESIEKQMESGKEESDSKDRELEAPVSPAIQQRLKTIADAHWKKWMDEPVPALNGMTPREASKDETGKDLLKSLLLYYEQQDRKSPHNSFAPDVKALRAKLGI